MRPPFIGHQADERDQWRRLAMERTLPSRMPLGDRVPYSTYAVAKRVRKYACRVHGTWDRCWWWRRRTGGAR